MCVYLYIKDILNSIDDDDILIFLYNKKIIDEKTLREKLKLSDADSLPKLNSFDIFKVDLSHHCIDDDGLLDDIDLDTLADYLEKHGYDIELRRYTIPANTNKHQYLKDVMGYVYSNYSRVYTKEDFKREICKLIDEELYV